MPRKEGGIGLFHIRNFTDALSDALRLGIKKKIQMMKHGQEN